MRKHIVTRQYIWLWIGAIIAAVAASVLGVSWETLLIAALVLACPVAMYFMMRGREK